MPKLHIFLSHKLSSDTLAARQFISHLTTYSQDQIEVVSSAEFPRGEEWEPKIRAALDTADWLILLFTDAEENWDWCLYETGYFRARMDAASGKRLICLYKATISPPNPLRTFNPAPATDDEIDRLLRDIYENPPWAIFPRLFSREFEDRLAATKQKLLEACNGNIMVVENYDLSPTISLKLTAEQIAHWPVGTIPAEALVDGRGEWQQMFGKAPGTGGWEWEQLVAEMPNKQVWIELLSAIMRDAYARKKSQFLSTVILGYDPSETWRLTIRRIERYRDDSICFYFSCVQLPLPFPAAHDEEGTQAFHLLNLSWSFRRRIVETHFPDLCALGASPLVDPASFDRLRDQLRCDLMQVYADSQIRGIQSPLDVLPALTPGPDEAGGQILRGLQQWPEWNRELLAVLETGMDKIDRAIELVHHMAEVNHYFYIRAAQAYAEHAVKLCKKYEEQYHQYQAYRQAAR